MKLNKQIIIILVLLSFLLSAIGAAAYFYIKHQKTEQENKKMVTIYVASKDIPKGAIINEEHVKQTSVAKKYLLTKPLLKKEIIGKFAKEAIYKNDIFRKEKISSTLEEEAKSVIKEFKYNSYNIAFKLFQNPNYSLRQNDIIDIISVYDNKKDNGEINIQDPYKVQIVADNVRVLGFLENGGETGQSINEKVVTRVVKKKQVKEKVKVKSDEVLLDITSSVLLKLIDDYNKGKQIWMVKTKAQKPVKTAVVKPKTTKKRIKIAYKEYPYRVYSPKDRLNTLTATIHYADDEKASIKKSKKVMGDEISKCKEEGKYIVGTAKYIHFRSGPSFKNKILRTIYKNIIIPYKEKLNDNWYLTCDGYYINASQVEETDKVGVEKKLKQKYPSKKPVVKKVIKKTEIKEVILDKPAVKTKQVAKTKPVVTSGTDTKISVDFKKCKAKNQFLVGRTDLVHLRRGPSLEHKITDIYSKGDKIAFDKKVNDSWYITCEGKYVNGYEVDIDK